MKSSYELAMERLNKTAPANKLTDAQKKQLAELDSKYTAKIAGREIALNGEIEAIGMARVSLQKLGYDPKLFHADVPPSSIKGPYDLPDGNHVPYCDIRWDSPEPKTLEEQQYSDHLHFQFNLEKKTLIGITIVSRKIWKTPPKIDVKPELESDYQKRIQEHMVVRTNAPAASMPQ